jgi:hypothetical protein
MKALGLLLIAGCAFAADPPDELEGARLLWDTGLLAKRPAARRPIAASVPAVRPALKYRLVREAALSLPRLSPQDAVVGVTFWRLRAPLPADDPSSRLLVLEEGAATQSEFTAERIEADAPLTAGDRVRLSIEVPRSGFLYVLDREQYADGTLGPAYLLYPNWQTQPGANTVAAGKVIEIPDQKASPNHFRLRRSRADHVGEVLEVLVTPKPLEGVSFGKQPEPLEEKRVAEWEREYFVQAERFELDGGAGRTMTAPERAGRLTQLDAAPQTLYRIPNRPSGQALLLRLPIRIATRGR